MIKRRFYRDTHGDKDAPSEESSSSSSGSEVEAEATDDTDIEEEGEEEEEEDEDKEEENAVADVREKGEASSSSGYESEDSSVNEVNLDSSGLPTSDEDGAAQIGSKNLIGSFAAKEGNSLPIIAEHSPKKDETEFDMTDYVLKRNSVFKCRICPRIVCLSEETLKAHLSSKKHARSEKLLSEGRLKLMLNDAGKVEGEMDYEDRTTTRASRQKSDRPNFKGKGRGKQRKRPRQDMECRKMKPSAEKREKRRKSDD